MCFVPIAKINYSWLNVITFVWLQKKKSKREKKKKKHMKSDSIKLNDIT